IPKELQIALETNKNFQAAFKALTPGKQREYCEYIELAKQEKTKMSRLEKIKPMILKGVGLNDKYKNR
ncbi:MAG: YdeI/OmpD-associated family protein, partial [Xanthomarina gelatinilytica]|nr:YdeI/OmpD-associated family protein [Xanthomarina gelatinilytica]